MPEFTWVDIIQIEHLPEQDKVRSWYYGVQSYETTDSAGHSI